MPTREEMIRDLKRQKMIDDLKAYHSGGSNVAAAPDSSLGGALRGAKETAQDTVAGMAYPGVEAGTKINAALRAGGQEIGDLFRDKQNQRDFKDRYEEYYNQSIAPSRQVYEQAAERSPIATPAGELSGQIAIGMAAPELRAGSGLIPAATRVAQAGAQNYAQTALTSHEADPFSGDASKAGILGTEIQAGLEALPVVGKYGAKALAKPAKYALSILGPKVSTMDEYLARAPQINSAPEESALKGMVDQDVARAAQEADVAQRDVGLARNEASTTKQIAALKAQAAKSAADQSYTHALYGLKNTRPPEKLAGDIAANIEQMGKELSEKSTQSFDVARDVTLPTAKFKSYLTSEIKNLEINGAPPLPGTDAEKTYNKLVGMRDAFDQYGTELGGQDLKKIVKNYLDPEIQWSLNAGERPEIYQKSIRGLRGNISEELKGASEPYRKIMDQLAPDTKLVKDMSEVFGDESKAIGALKAAADPTNPRGRMYRDLLKKYDERNGTKLLKELDASLEAKRTLNDPGAREMMEILNPDAFAARRIAREAADESSGADTAVNWARESADRAAAKQRQYSRLGPGSTEGVIRSVGQGRNIESEKQLAQLGKESGQDYVQYAKDLNTRRAFDKDYTHGSRGVNFGQAVGKAVVGGGLGAWSSDQFDQNAAGGGALGALAGLLGDKYGGRVVKAILDGALKAKQVNQLMSAVQRGPAAVALTHSIMMKGDAEYRKAVESQSK